MRTAVCGGRGDTPATLVVAARVDYADAVIQTPTRLQANLARCVCFAQGHFFAKLFIYSSTRRCFRRAPDFEVGLAPIGCELEAVSSMAAASVAAAVAPARGERDPP